MRSKYSLLVLIVVTLTIGVVRVKAQNYAPMFSQHMFSTINFNPSAVPVKQEVQAAVYTRFQWVGFNASPITGMLDMHGYSEEMRSGFGASIVGDRFGHSDYINAKLAYSYHIRLNRERNMHLSIGASAGVLYKTFNVHDIRVADQGDQFVPIIMEELRDSSDRYVRPDLDFGISFTYKKLNIGLSVTHLTYLIYGKKDKQNMVRPYINYFTPDMGIYGHISYEAMIGKNVAVRPYLRVYGIATEGSPSLTDRFDHIYDIGWDVKAEFDLQVEFWNIFWIGGGYRYTDVAKIMAGISIMNNVDIGYCYDFYINSLKDIKPEGKTFVGSHEIVLSLRLPTGRQLNHPAVSPRYFGTPDSE